MQLLRWLLLPLLALLAINAFFSHRSAVATANRAFDRLLVASAHAISEDVVVREGELIVDLPYAALQLLEANLQERVFYRVIAPGGHTLTGYDELRAPNARVAGQEEVLYAGEYRGEPLHQVALYKQLYDPDMREPVVIIVAETGEARNALSRRLLVDSLRQQGLLIVCTALLMWFGLSRGLRPLMRLRDSVAKRPSSDLSPIDVEGLQREVRPLIEAINQHTARVDRLISGRQKFIADASHQMRTPLAEMRTQVEYSLRQQRPELAHATLADVQDGLDALARLIGQLLLLARSDPDALEDQRLGPLNLTALAQATALEFAPAARKNGMELSFDDGGRAVAVLGNGLLLREMIANLIDNAIRHGGRGGSIVVRVVRREAATLEIEDDGPGIAAAEREAVFERFYRGPGCGTAGSGLGLPIARNIAIAHRARIELDTPASGRGLCVRVCLTAADCAAATP